MSPYALDISRVSKAKKSEGRLKKDNNEEFSEKMKGISVYDLY